MNLDEDTLPVGISHIIASLIFMVTMVFAPVDRVVAYGIGVVSGGISLFGIDFIYAKLWKKR